MKTRQSETAEETQKQFKVENSLSTDRETRKKELQKL